MLNSNHDDAAAPAERSGEEPSSSASSRDVDQKTGQRHKPSSTDTPNLDERCYGVDGCGLGVQSFYAAHHPTDKCGPRGLPLTPNSVRILGNMQRIIALSHPNIARYVHIETGAGERVFLVAEQYERTLAQRLNSRDPLSIDECVAISFGILSGIEYLHNNGIVCRSIRPETLELTHSGRVKLAQYALFTATDCGAAVKFPTSLPRYLSPSVVRRGPYSHSVGNPKDDVWALGLTLLEMLTSTRAFSVNLKPSVDQMGEDVGQHHAHTKKTDTYSKSTRSSHRGGDGDGEGDCSIRNVAEKQTTDAGACDLNTVLRTLLTLGSTQGLDDYKGRSTIKEKLAYLDTFCPTATAVLLPRVLQGTRPSDEEEDDDDRDSSGSGTGKAARGDSSKSCLFSGLVEITFKCLCPSSALRPTIRDILDQAPFLCMGNAAPALNKQLRCKGIDHEWSLISASLRTSTEYLHELDQCIEENPLYGMSLSNVMYLWSLTTRSVEAHLADADDAAKAPIHRLPRLVRLGRPEIGAKANPAWVFNPTISKIDVSTLVNHLKGDQFDRWRRVLPLDGLPLTEFRDEMAIQPLQVRWRNLSYQFGRVLKYTRLLSGAPFTYNLLCEEAHVDIPPNVRGEVWHSLLQVTEDLIDAYNDLDLDMPTETDHQLDVDIPRCHQYDPFLSSPAGHGILKRVLKAWIHTNPHLVYWQGLDSVSAVFVRLNFQNEALAHACLCKFVDKFAPNLFRQHNTLVLNEFLGLLWNILAYHDPELWWHLEEMMFKPDLFAIPWFLTCYAHVFSLDKIFVLWDALLLSSASMLIFFGAAILKQLRAELLTFEFNECILHFGDAPDVDIETTVRIAQEMAERTPTSITAMHYAMNYSDSDTAEGNRPVQQPLPHLSIEEFEELHFSSTTHQPIPAASARMLCVDVRPASSFFSAHCSGLCFNLPKHELFTGSVGAEMACDLIANNAHGRPIVILGDSATSDAHDVALALVKKSIPFVCLLDGGISGLRKRGILSQRGKDVNLDIILERLAASSSHE